MVNDCQSTEDLMAQNDDGVDCVVPPVGKILKKVDLGSASPEPEVAQHLGSREAEPKSIFFVLSENSIADGELVQNSHTTKKKKNSLGFGSG